MNYHRLLTGDMGQLLPCGLVEVLPGDTFRHRARAYVRLSPMAAPVMHPMTIRLDHFFVPMRLAWPSSWPVSWETFITGGANNDDTSQLPTAQTSGQVGDLFDYLGCPLVTGVDVSNLPLKVYNLCFNEFYRDQDLVPERAEFAQDIANIAWEKDYFSTARPWPQKGPEVTLPLATTAPVKGIGPLGNTYGAGAPFYETGASAARTPTSARGTSATELQWEEDPNNAGFPGIFADLSQAAAASITAIRRAFALQRYAENRARWGSRYSEYLRKGFGATPPDARLQRPEYLGGSRQRVSVSEVLQTAPGQTPRFGVGDLYGHGIGLARNGGYRAKFQEHGYVISLLSIRPKAMYTNGVERTWLRRDREDFFQPELQFVGQQQVWQQEVYATGVNKDNVFGWSDRYQEYRYQRSGISGEFRQNLDYWHLGRKFATEPALNESFVECKPSKRIFNEQTANSLWIAVDHSIAARRRVSRNAAGRVL